LTDIDVIFLASTHPTSYGGPVREYPKILWLVDPLLGNDRETKYYTIAVTRQLPVNSSTRKVFSVWSLPRCYKQKYCCGSAVVRYWHKKLVAEAGDSSGTQRKENVRR
jgi:hypothetical protein